uniref:Uncharacterized protein n=1 Tax=Glossina austeni TaxID=7395 RepID=A0A1A9USJ4_GLOAU
MLTVAVLLELLELYNYDYNDNFLLVSCQANRKLIQHKAKLKALYYDESAIMCCGNKNDLLNSLLLDKNFLIWPCALMTICFENWLVVEEYLEKIESILVLAQLLKLVRVLQTQYCGDELEMIDAVLIYAIILPDVFNDSHLDSTFNDYEERTQRKS